MLALEERIIFIAKTEIKFQKWRIYYINIVNLVDYSSEN